MLCVVGAGWVPGWVQAQGWAQASQGEISAHVMGPIAQCQSSMYHLLAASLPFCLLAAKFLALPGAPTAPGIAWGWGTGLRGTLCPQLILYWDIGWVTPVPASRPDRGAPACPMSHLRGGGAWQRDFGLGTMLHMTASFCLVRGRQHVCSYIAPCPQMPDEEGNISSPLSNSLQLALARK